VSSSSFVLFYKFACPKVISMRHRDRMLSISFPCDFPKYSRSQLRELFSPTHRNISPDDEEEVEVLSYWEQHILLLEKNLIQLSFLIILREKCQEILFT
jgi:hypothetical protein